jgi:hypothetical protein
MDNEIHRLQLLEERLMRGKPVNELDARRLSQLATWREIRAGFDQLFAEVCLLEDAGLRALLSGGELSLSLRDSLQAARRTFDGWLLSLYLQRYEKPDEIIVTIFSESSGLLMILADAYAHIVAEAKGLAEVWQYLPAKPSRGKDASPPLERRLIVDAARFWKQKKSIKVRRWDHAKKTFLAEENVANPLEGMIGLALVIHAKAALPRFVAEAGLHTLRTTQVKGHCLVDTAAGLLRDYVPPEGIERRGAIGNQPKRRFYDFVGGVIEDPRADGKLYANVDNLHLALVQALDQALAKNVKAILE